MNITTTGRSEPVVLEKTGTYFINIDGANFGGTSVQIDWRASDADVWTPLKDENGDPLAATEATNKEVLMGDGEMSYFLTGGTAIDLDVSTKRKPA